MFQTLGQGEVFSPTWSPHLDLLWCHQSYSQHIDSLVYLKQRIRTAFSRNDLPKVFIKISALRKYLSIKRILVCALLKITYNSDPSKAILKAESPFPFRQKYQILFFLLSLKTTSKNRRKRFTFSGITRRKQNIHRNNFPLWCHVTVWSLRESEKYSSDQCISLIIAQVLGK